VQKLLLVIRAPATTGGLQRPMNWPGLALALCTYRHPYGSSEREQRACGAPETRHCCRVSITLCGMLGCRLFAIAAGVAGLPEYRPVKQFGNNFAVPALCSQRPVCLSASACAPDRDRCLVPGSGSWRSLPQNSLHAQHPPRVHQQEIRPIRRSADGEWVC